MNDRFKDYFPAGYDTTAEYAVLFFGTLRITVISLLYFSDLYSVIYNKDEIVIIPTFIDLAGKYIRLYIIEIFVLLSFIGVHYSYHFKGSKSIYLMKRLPDSNELIRRCVTMPIIFSVIVAIVALVIFAIYFVIYVYFTVELF